MVDVMKFKCPNGKKECEKQYDFEENAIFVWSKDICVADEVFTQFFACRGRREIYFATYVYEMNSTYRDSNSTSAEFLSCPTFVSCVMSWIANQDIDFRSKDAICPFCGHNPEVLACDGVYVGVSLKYLGEMQSIAASEKLEAKKVLHRRFTRTLICGLAPSVRQLRVFLDSFCRNILDLGKKKSATDVPDTKETKTIENSDLIQNKLLKRIIDHRCKTVLKSLFDQEYPLELAKTIAQFIINLNGTAALTNFFPHKDRKWLLELFSKLQVHDTLSQEEMYSLLKQLKEFRTQFAGIIKTALRYDRCKEIAGFFKYLIAKTDRIHSQDHLFMPDDPEIVDPYDPTKGVAYHFTEHGGQIRKLPKYAMEGKYYQSDSNIFL